MNLNNTRRKESVVFYMDGMKDQFVYVYTIWGLIY